MTRKRIQLVLLVALMTSLLFAQQTIKPGMERWSIKTSLPEHVIKTPTTITTISYGNFAALKDIPGVAMNDKRYESERIPDKIDNSKYKEGDIVAVEGYVHVVSLEPNGEYHIQISDSPTMGDQCIFVEIPNPEKEFVSDDAVREMIAAPREFVTTKLLRGNPISSRGNVMIHPPYVRVVGQLFYDDSHVGDLLRGKKGMKATTLWEIHPVTAMAFAPTPKAQ